MKTAILLTTIGGKGRDIYELFTFETDGDNLKLKPVLDKFAEYCQPRKNLTMLRYKLFSYRQQDGQLFSDYLMDLKKLGASCELGGLQDDLTRHDSLWCIR